MLKKIDRKKCTPDLDSRDMGFRRFAYFSGCADAGIRLLGYACPGKRIVTIWGPILALVELDTEYLGTHPSQWCIKKTVCLNFEGKRRGGWVALKGELVEFLLNG